MPRYFFDIYANDGLTSDKEGTDCADLAAARMEAMRTLPAIAKDEVAKDGDRQAYTALVRDDKGRAVYSATLIFAGLWI